MSETKSYQNNQGLVEWSKWISGISLFSASGCVGVLVTKGVGEKNIINIKLAIVFFLLSIVVAWLIQLTIAMQEQNSSFQDGRKPGSQILLKSLITLEILMFLLSCFYLARWVWKFPAVKPVQEIISPVTLKTDSTKPDSTKSAFTKPGSAKQESVKPGPAKSASGKPSSRKLAPIKQDSAKQDPAKQDPVNPDSAKQDSIKYDPAN